MSSVGEVGLLRLCVWHGWNVLVVGIWICLITSVGKWNAKYEVMVPACCVGLHMYVGGCVRVGVYVCSDVFVCVHIWVCVLVHMCLGGCVRMFGCVCVCAHLGVYTCTYMLGCVSAVCGYESCGDMLVCVCTCSWSCCGGGGVHVYTYTYLWANIALPTSYKCPCTGVQLCDRVQVMGLVSVGSPFSPVAFLLSCDVL